MAYIGMAYRFGHSIMGVILIAGVMVGAQTYPWVEDNSGMCMDMRIDVCIDMCIDPDTKVYPWAEDHTDTCVRTYV